MKKLVEDGVANNIKSAKKMVDTSDAPRSGTRSKSSSRSTRCCSTARRRCTVWAFRRLSRCWSRAARIKLHPLVCTAYNADFDGDQMAIHVPLSAEAQAEARIPHALGQQPAAARRTASPVTVPTQDMVLGSYYLTYVQRGSRATGMVVHATPEEAHRWRIRTGAVRSRTRRSRSA